MEKSTNIICIHINDAVPIPKQETQVDLINKINDTFEETLHLILNTSNDQELGEKIRTLYAPFTIIYNIAQKQITNG